MTKSFSQFDGPRLLRRDELVASSELLRICFEGPEITGEEVVASYIFPGFMNDLRPILQARVRAKLLGGLRFEQSGPLLAGTATDQFAIVRGSDHLELDGAGMTRLVMGNAEGEMESIRLPGALAEVIPALFPLPSFLPGLNYR